MSEVFHVVDLFAGPGGLAEGFSTVRDQSGKAMFKLALSVEREPAAHATLLLRAFCRQFPQGGPPEYFEYLNGGMSAEPDWAEDYPDQWKAANDEALLLELGTEAANAELQPKLEALKSVAGDRIVVIGGPPCQAYSVVGRARNRNKAGYDPKDDPRHYLYREYIAILESLRPAAFVMENVKGLMSSSVDGQAMYELVLADLKAAGGENSYRLYALDLDKTGKAQLFPSVKPADFLIFAENFGVPQTRHRVIIVGLRTDLGQSALTDAVVNSASVKKATLRHVLSEMPRLRSGLSRQDNSADWVKASGRALQSVLTALRGSDDPDHARVLETAELVNAGIRDTRLVLERSSTKKAGVHEDCPRELEAWLVDERLTALTRHESRSHMESDLARYAFAALFAAAHDRSPTSSDFPPALAPAHENWNERIFSDRFRVQRWDAPSTTITSHIAKDGHYFIHPDPVQCRALTVREAARLQTFPDNYLFKGNRTEQYTQVGNAVPPFLARQIGEALCRLLARADIVRSSSRREADAAQPQLEFT